MSSEKKLLFRTDLNVACTKCCRMMYNHVGSVLEIRVFFKLSYALDTIEKSKRVSMITKNVIAL